jgi:hypothetical protein
MTNFRKYILLSLFLALINAVVLLIFFVPRFDHTDTSQYISTINHVFGDKNAELIPYRIMKPMPILIGAVISPIFGAKGSLIAQNVFFYFLLVYLVFILINYLYKNPRQAFYGSVLVACAYPMLAYGLAALTDLPGWFFYLSSIFLSLKFIEKPQFKTAFLAGIVAGFGMLFKENLAAAPLFFGSLVLISQASFKDKLKYVFVFSLAFILFPTINSIVMYKLFSYSYFSNYMAAWGNGPVGGFKNFYMISPLRIIIEIGRSFMLGWIFVLLGTWKEFVLMNKDRIKIFISLLLPSISFFAWSYPHNRMVFIAFPVLAILGSLGIMQKFNNQKSNNLIELGLLFLYVLINYFFLEFFLRYGPIIQPSGTLFG